MVSDRIYLALDLAFQCQGWMKSRFRTLSVDNFTLKSWNNLWNENSKFWKNRRRQLLHVEKTACLFSILCAFKSAFRTNCAWRSSLEIWVLDFVKIVCTLICECLKISLMICVNALNESMGLNTNKIYVSPSCSFHKGNGIIPVICATFEMNESASYFSLKRFHFWGKTVPEVLSAQRPPSPNVSVVGSRAKEKDATRDNLNRICWMGGIALTTFFLPDCGVLTTLVLQTV